MSISPKDLEAFGNSLAAFLRHHKTNNPDSDEAAFKLLEDFENLRGISPEEARPSQSTSTTSSATTNPPAIGTGRIQFDRSSLLSIAGPSSPSLSSPSLPTSTSPPARPRAGMPSISQTAGLPSPQPLRSPPVPSSSIPSPGFSPHRPTFEDLPASQRHDNWRPQHNNNEEGVRRPPHSEYPPAAPRSPQKDRTDPQRPRLTHRWDEIGAQRAAARQTELDAPQAEPEETLHSPALRSEEAPHLPTPRHVLLAPGAGKCRNCHIPGTPRCTRCHSIGLACDGRKTCGNCKAKPGAFCQYQACLRDANCPDSLCIRLHTAQKEAQEE